MTGGSHKLKDQRMILPPKYFPVLIPGTCEYPTLCKDSADVLTEFEMGRFILDQCNHRVLVRGKREGQSQTDDGKMEAETAH